MYLENPNLENKERHPHPIVESFRRQILGILEITDGIDLKGLSKKLDDLFQKFLGQINKDFSQYSDQCLFFQSFCELINLLEQKFLGINNNIPKIGLHQYNSSSVGEQLLHNSYIGGLGEDVFCEGGNHSYWTLLFYKIFKKLKDAGLDINIKIFKFKDPNARMMEMDMKGYSGLIIKLHKDYYLVDSGRIFLLNGLGKIVKPMDELIDSLKDEAFKKRISSNDGHLLRELEKGRNNSHFLFFDNDEDFIGSIDEYLEPPHFSLYVDNNNKPKNKPGHVIHFYFTHDGIKIENGPDTFEYVFKKNYRPDKNSTIDDFFENLQTTRENWNDEQSNNILMKSLEIIKDRVDFVKLCEYYSRLRMVERTLNNQIMYLNSYFYGKK